MKVLQVNMSHYTDFKLYWEQWGGYPAEAKSFGNPSLLWILSKGENLGGCKVYRTIQGSQDITDHAVWRQLANVDIEALKCLIQECIRYDGELVVSNPDGDYRFVDDITGVIGNQPFHFSINYCCPGESWTSLGKRLRNILFSMQNKFDDE
jgi:hypothetical protein